MMHSSKVDHTKCKSTEVIVGLVTMCNRCLASLGILSDTAQVSMEQSMTVSEQKAKLMKLKAHISSYVEKREGKKSLYTYYCIEVTCQHQMGPEEIFVVERRYSDFHTFHLQLKTKVICCIR